MDRLISTPFRVTCSVLFVAAVLGAGTPGTLLHAQSSAEAVFDDSTFDALEWRNVGPNRGGRSIAVAGTTARPNEYYFGATGGGVWKTVDGGANWFPVGDGQFATPSAGALGQCEADPDVVYAGFGEVQLRGNVIPGDGVYRTTDGGETWTHLGLDSETGQQMVGRVRVHPDDCDTAFAAVLGDPFGPNETRGVYRTRDGGENWEQVLFESEQAGAVDLVLDPSNPDVIYAGFWEVFRRPWMLHSGGPGSGLYKSMDGGDTWTELSDNPGLPEGLWGKVGVSVSGADPDRVYAIVEAEDGGVFRSDDGGESWEHVSDDRNLRQRAFYYTRIYADPMDPETVYVLNVQFWRSRDGGEEWESISVPHGDNHDLWIDPTDNLRMIEANDGGANVSLNAGSSWTGQLYPTAQMYTISTTSHYPYHICGGQQDNSTVCVPSDGNGSYWYSAGGCESGWVQQHLVDPELFYAGCYGGQLTAYDQETGQARSVQVWPVNPMGHSAWDIRERFQWTFPIVSSPLEPDLVYVASQHLWRSTNRGQSWEQISPDLTLAEEETLGPSGGPITRDQTSVEYYATIFSIAPSHFDAATIWTGSDDGLVHITRDGGENWTDVTPEELPEFSRIHFIDASPHEPGKAVLAATRYRSQDVTPYIYRTDDFGDSWTRITDGIPEGHHVRGVREDPVRPGLLFAGTEKGVWVSFDDGQNWQSLQLDLPAVSIHALEVRDDDVIIASHGRGYWVLDDITPLRQLSTEVAEARAHLFEPATAVRSRSRTTYGDGRYIGGRSKDISSLNVYYHLAEPADEVELEILDADGEVIRSFTATRDEEEDPGEADPPETERDEPEEE
ncbi:MAG: VPS10 domain-containing protein, partial [Gemmatimonadota bacterium]